MRETVECIICNHKETLNYGKDKNEELKLRNFCYSCNEVFEILYDVNKLKEGQTIPGTLNIWITPNYEALYARDYVDSPTQEVRKHLGAGGTEFEAWLTDGTKQVSNDVWNVGTIPMHLRQYFQPNVETLTQGGVNIRVTEHKRLYLVIDDSGDISAFHVSSEEEIYDIMWDRYQEEYDYPDEYPTEEEFYSENTIIEVNEINGNSYKEILVN